MPSYVIHLATGNQYIKKYNEDINNKEEFLKGIIAPDQFINKRESHYGVQKEIESLINFLKANKDKLNDDFTKGYFLHLYADYLMYLKYFPDVTLYEDYDKTNQYITEKYHVKLPENLSQYGNFKTGKPKYLTYEFLDKFIDEVTYKSIKDIIQDLEGEYYEHKN